MDTEASINVAGKNIRDEFIRSKIKSRVIMQFFKQKKNNFKVCKKKHKNLWTEFLSIFPFCYFPIFRLSIPYLIFHVFHKLGFWFLK